ncbi:ABC transporter permease [Elioraea sp.]|uniref:ABC transporter permease n=1 Tax=Elioraea sp. TaxID=2185103 RepID=UPI0025C067BB|nr:ABC transporter permease [Elioraea sp.]
MTADAARLPAPAAAPAAPGALRMLARRSGTVLMPLGFAVSVLLLWEFLVRFYAVPTVILPAPSVVWARILSAWPFLLTHLVPTTVETVVGFLLSMILGTTLATFLVYGRRFREAVYPTVVFFQLIPKIALAPLFIVWLGIGSESRLAFSVFISFFPVVIATMAGLRAVPPDMLRLCRSLTATEAQVFAAVRFPYALPYIFSGMKIAVTFAMIGVIVGEFITAQAGLGYLILFASSQAETPLILASIATLCVIGLVLYGAVALAEKAMLRWYGSA